MIEKKFDKTLKNSVLSKATLVGVMIALGQSCLAVDDINVTGVGQLQEQLAELMLSRVD